jgi:6-pyruvoyl-tetrahydropterin synthase
MYTVTVSAGFEASHNLQLPDGQWEPVHRHVWNVVVEFVGPKLDPTGTLVDFVAAQARLREITAPLANTHLNDWADLRGRNPSAERIAQALSERLAADPALAATLHRVTVSEAPGCTASFVRDPTGVMLNESRVC